MFHNIANRLGLAPLLFGVLWVAVPACLWAQTAIFTQTLQATVSPLGGLFTITSPITLSHSGSNFNSFTGTVSINYRARTYQGSGYGSITLKATADFTPSGGPSIANPPSAGDKFTYTCGSATLGNACSGVQTVSTTATGGGGRITLKVTSDFACGGGPCIATPPTTGDALTYTCTVASPGTGCTGTQTTSTTATTNQQQFYRQPGTVHHQRKQYDIYRGDRGLVHCDGYGLPRSHFQ